MTKFLTPSELPEEVVCRTIKVPNSLEWLGIFNAVLLAGTYYYNWSDDVPGHMTREEAAAAYSEIFYEYLNADMSCSTCVLPGGSPVVGLDELGNWRMLDNGDWGPPSGDYAIPAYTARTEPTADERKCLAAKNAANVLAQVYEQLADDVSHGITLAEIALNVGLTIGLLIAPPLGALALATIQIGLNAFKLVASIAEFITEDVWTESFTDSLVCTLLNNATDTAGVVTFDFNNVRRQLVNETFWLDPTLLEQQLTAQVDNLLQNIGAEGLNLAGETTAITDADCSDCEPTWAYQWDFTVDPGNWTIYPGQPGSQNSCGLETGLTFAGADPSRGRRQLIWQFLSFPDVEVLSIYGEQEIASIGNVSAGASGIGIYQNAFSVIVTTGLGAVGHNSGGMVGDWTGVTDWQILMSVGACDGCGDPGGSGCWTIITMTGRGELPSEFFGGTEL